MLCRVMKKRALWGNRENMQICSEATGYLHEVASGKGGRQTRDCRKGFLFSPLSCRALCLALISPAVDPEACGLQSILGAPSTPAGPSAVVSFLCLKSTEEANSAHLFPQRVWSDYLAVFSLRSQVSRCHLCPILRKWVLNTFSCLLPAPFLGTGSFFPILA